MLSTGTATYDKHLRIDVQLNLLDEGLMLEFPILSQARCLTDRGYRERHAR